tara:strand:- start:1205 stop:1933 length:729 start_codon:yes stop_codon:yes gene_type:complete
MIQQYGTVYGGFYLPKDMKLNKDSIVYCVGAGEDISLDIEISDKYGCDVHTFDPTPRSIYHVNMIKDFFEGRIERPKSSKRYGGGDPKYIDMVLNRDKSIGSRIKFYDYGWHTFDGEVSFYRPSNPEFVSHTCSKEFAIAKHLNLKNSVTVNVKCLKTIMKELNHNKIDFLKLDIEGLECDILNEMFHILDNDKLPKYICVDFDGRRANFEVKKYDLLMEKFKNNGYVVLKNTNYDISFERK